MKWTAPPERREVVLVLFSISAYLLAYNIETSLNYVGIDPIAAQGALFRQIGIKTKILGRDGRKPAGWRDKLESVIFGTWAWDEGHIAGDGLERSQPFKGRGQHGAQWTERKIARALDVPRFGEDTVNDSHQWWKDDIPTSKVVKHVPGYTILENVILHNGTVYIVSDEQNSIPPIRSIVETTAESVGDWKVIGKKDASSKLGKYGGLIKGVSWMSVNPPSNTTLIELWRMYSSLDPHIDAQGHTTLPPPRRLILPQITVFTDADPLSEAPKEEHMKPRHRTDTGLKLLLLKAAFPQMDVQYKQDWEDYHRMDVPFVIERLVVSDTAAAARSVNEGQPSNSPPFGLDVSSHWWEPVRRTLVAYFDRLDEEAKAAQEGEYSFWSFKSKAKKIITYIDNHSDATKTGKSALIPGDYEYFSRSLKKLGRDNGYEVHIISTDSTERSWDSKDGLDRPVVVGVHGDHLFDAVWMRPSPQTTFMEDREVLIRSLGINYIAWWTNQRFSSEALPETTKESNDPVHINTDNIIKEIQAVLSAKQQA
ncbi:hypothetical protein DFP72DRAFT_871230 [Ephemerocybe angulata]|uniref:Uncharacterized protein n=1 Tax=Ephemerocybe angulata TaxID=980116 RepID=A0A8H6II59_9AGAR|nr:hypothetical protein DFP72DRAFT_871230 [Tulosesus angulatus]